MRAPLQLCFPLVESVVHYSQYRGNMPILVGQTEPCEAEKVAREDAETSESTRSAHMVGIHCCLH